MWQGVERSTWGLVILVLLAAAAYTRGWWFLRNRRRGHRLATIWRLGCALAGTAALLVALLPPVATYEQRSFFVHMIQHEMLIEVAPTLLWLAQPISFWLWGLPARWRRTVSHNLFAPRQRKRWHRFTAPTVLVPLYLATVTLWHLPPAYDAALERPWLHSLEHLSLFATAMAFWWLVTGAAPRLHPRAGFQLPILYVVAAYVHNEVLGVGLTILRQPIYAFYDRVVPPWGLSPIADQSLGGAIMWIPGEFIYAITIMVLLMRLLDEGEPFHGIFESYPLSEKRSVNVDT